jgi:hypothetical protein
MNIHQLLHDKDFLKKDQFEKRDILEKYILSDQNCKIGISVLCFEKEIIFSANNRYFYKRYTRHICDVTIGKQYKILAHKKGKIKIENNSGRKLWFSINRFLFYLKLERKEKLDKILIK